MNDEAPLADPCDWKHDGLLSAVAPGAGVAPDHHAFGSKRVWGRW
jgi:hypothetical protein